MPPRMPSRALVVFFARFSPSGTLIVTRTPARRRGRRPRRRSSRIICRGTGLMAGPPTSSPSPGLVTTPTPTPPSSCSPGSVRQRTVAVRCAPCVTSGSSPASLTTTASARPPDTSQRSTAKRDAPLVRQHDLDARLRLLGEQRGGRGLGRGRAAGAGRPAAAQRRRCAPSPCAAGRARAARARSRQARRLGRALSRARELGPRVPRSSTLRCSWKWPGW